MIRFDKKWFNPLYFILNDIIKDPTVRTVFVYGGKSSAKTVSICQLFGKEAVVNHASTIAFRKESNIIKTTLKKSFNLAIENMYLHPAFEYLEFAYRTPTAEIILKGLDNEEKAKGIESYKYLYLDELNHFTKQEFDQFNLSLRGIPGQKIFASWNPVDENLWIKKNIIDTYEWVETEYKLPCPTSFVRKSKDGKTVLIKTTYEDNYWIVGSPCGTYGYRDENLIAEYEALRTRDYYSYRINVLGEWGIITEGVLFRAHDLKYFKRSEFKSDGRQACFGYADIADEGTDYFSMPIGEIFPKKVFVTDALFTGANVSTTLPASAAMLTKHNFDYARIESNGMGSIFLKDLRKLVNEAKVLPIFNSQQKHTRIILQELFIKDYFYFLAPGEYATGSDYDKFMRGVFGYQRRKEDNKKDENGRVDAVDSLSGLAMMCNSFLPHLFK